MGFEVEEDGEGVVDVVGAVLDDGESGCHIFWEVWAEGGFDVGVGQPASRSLDGRNMGGREAYQTVSKGIFLYRSTRRVFLYHQTPLVCVSLWREAFGTDQVLGEQHLFSFPQRSYRMSLSLAIVQRLEGVVS